MSDLRQRRMVVLEENSLGERATDEYIEKGYGVILVPDLSRVPRASADYFLTATADTIEEFVKGNQEVIFLKKKGARRASALERILAKREVRIQTRPLD